MLATFFIVLAAIVIAGGLLARRRLDRVARGEEPVVTDDVVRRILREGELPADELEPLDEDAIREEEDRFWAEEWDEPEEW